jgi:hypothetical protein
VFVRFHATGRIEQAEVLEKPTRGNAWYRLRLEDSPDETINTARKEVFEEGYVVPQDKGKQKVKEKKVDPWQKSHAKVWVKSIQWVRSR